MELVNTAKLESLESENAQLKIAMNSLGGQIRARKQAMDELFEANTNFLSSIILLEDLVTRLQSEANMFSDRIETLEKEKSDLKVKLDDLEKVA